MSASRTLNPPKQQRSQRSFERALAASAEILIQDGYDGFTLAKVSSLSGVSTGSIYGRIKTKDDLLHIVHQRELEAMKVEQDEIFVRLRDLERLDELVPELVREMAELLRNHSAILRPLMLRGAFDEAIRVPGKAAAEETRDQIASLLLARRDQILHPTPEQAVDICYTMMYATIARFLGFSAEPETTYSEAWDETIDAVADIFLRGLCST